VTKSELSEALVVALNPNESLLDVDMMPLYGLYTKDFKGPVPTTKRVVAAMIRHLAVSVNGQADAEALAEFGRIGRHRILVVG
jgi:hypothetical protein